PAEPYPGDSMVTVMPTGDDGERGIAAAVVHAQNRPAPLCAFLDLGNHSREERRQHFLFVKTGYNNTEGREIFPHTQIHFLQPARSEPAVQHSSRQSFGKIGTRAVTRGTP